MKTLFVMRHAKSDWNNPNQTDFERSLNERGRRAAPKIGRFMRAENLIPELIVASPAARATETARAVKDAAQFDCEIGFEPRIYEATVGDLFEVVRELPDDFARVLLVGHNPGFEDLVRNLTGKARALPTAALAHLELAVSDWRQTDFNDGKLVDLFEPKKLAE